MVRRTIIALAATLVTLGVMPLAWADAPKRGTSTETIEVSWNCPGRDPRERATVTTRETTFRRDGDRIRVTFHTQWRGWLTHRETGERIRDEGTWTDTYSYRGRDLVQIVTSGVVWRLVIPGHGIVMHQSGHWELLSEDDEPFQTPFAASPDFERGLCRYV
jgi:hypothetical protein